MTEPGRGVLIAAPASGSGKTSVTLGLLRALRNRSVAVRGAKSGPDYIDPRFHEAASGAACVNLDAWAMPDDRIRGRAAGPGLLIVEGAMGLFDGAPPDGRGSAADLARILGLPVVLVVDAARMAQSVAPLVAGFAHHDPEVRIAGVILNRVGSLRHAMTLRRALAPLGLPVLGAVPRDARLDLPSRHLGLVQAGERADLDAFLDRAAGVVAGACDLAALEACAAPLPHAAPLPPAASPSSAAPLPSPAPSLSAASSPSGAPAPSAAPPPSAAPLRSAAPVISAAPLPPVPPPGQRIALARDVAFAFAYPHQLADWRAAGAEIVPFSPLADDPVPEGADFVFLPGGYPELHAGRLAVATRFRESLRAAAARGVPVYGECGGFMALGAGLVDADGARHAMAGLLDLETSFAERRLHLGYRRVDVAAGPLAGVWAAHEFHYATTLSAEGAPLLTARDAEGADLGPAGLRAGSVSGSFLHLIDRAQA